MGKKSGTKYHVCKPKGKPGRPKKFTEAKEAEAKEAGAKEAGAIEAEIDRIAQAKAAKAAKPTPSDPSAFRDARANHNSMLEDIHGRYETADERRARKRLTPEKRLTVPRPGLNAN